MESHQRGHGHSMPDHLVRRSGKVAYVREERVPRDARRNELDIAVGFATVRRRGPADPGSRRESRAGGAAKRRAWNRTGLF
jgi:hypothetical protein